MEIKKNFKLIEKKRLLFAALHNKNITQAEFDSQIEPIEKEIWINVREAIKSEEERIKQNINIIKETKTQDGDLKRSVAKLLKDFLSPYFSEDEIRGIFRQGYRIMRGVSK